jgi:hypothetical protein
MLEVRASAGAALTMEQRSAASGPGALARQKGVSQAPRRSRRSKVTGGYGGLTPTCLAPSGPRIGDVDRQPMVIRLELYLTDDSPTGRATHGDRAGREFVGWMSLVAADRRARSRKYTGRGGQLTEGGRARSGVLNRASRQVVDDRGVLKAAFMYVDNYEVFTPLLGSPHRKAEIARAHPNHRHRRRYHLRIQNGSPAQRS